MAEGLTKKQLKELRKLEKMQARNLEKKSSNAKWIAISVISALFLLLFVGIVLVAKDKNKPATADGKVEIADGRYTRMVNSENTDATASADKNEQFVTLVEYADLQCPACKTYNPMVNQLLAAYPDRVKVVFKHYPLIAIHPNAMPSAKAAEAAGRQDKFFEFVDLAYEKQAEWSALSDAQPKFEEYAKSLGLDIEKFKTDLKDPQLETLINNDRNEGIKNGVTGTPSFFIEGQRISNPANLDEFKKIVDEALENKKGAASTQTEPQSVQATTVPDKLPLQQ